jgi:hypothetical protein
MKRVTVACGFAAAPCGKALPFRAKRTGRTVACGFAAAPCGKALPFRAKLFYL